MIEAAIVAEEHARVGVPVMVATMAIAAGWLWLRLSAGG